MGMLVVKRKACMEQQRERLKLHSVSDSFACVRSGAADFVLPTEELEPCGRRVACGIVEAKATEM